MKTHPSDTTELRWQKALVASLLHHVQSGNYYARFRVRGKLIWKSLRKARIGAWQGWAWVFPQGGTPTGRWGTPYVLKSLTREASDIVWEWFDYDYDYDYDYERTSSYMPAEAWC